ncbi:MAG: enoyl-CoA hydratase-related protein [Myxococcota bacterium]|nr:enoyl-CoA hydratase-related protein [Myxococcota bacterium]
MQKLTVNQAGGVVTLMLSRPEIHNAFDDELITQISNALEVIRDDASARVLVLAGAGRSFCAGADLNWMRSMVEYSEESNRQDSIRLAQLYECIDEFPKPVVARVQGAAIGGGCGLVATADIVVAGPRARFALSEVRLGLAPAVISPFVTRKIGTSRAREMFLTGRRIRPDEALRYGLIHEVVSDEALLDDAVTKWVKMLLLGGPDALAACKVLAREADQWDAPRARTAAMIARLRTGNEGQSGMRAFLNKAAPPWHSDEGEESA